LPVLYSEIIKGINPQLVREIRIPDVMLDLDGCSDVMRMKDAFFSLSELGYVLSSR